MGGHIAWHPGAPGLSQWRGQVEAQKQLQLLLTKHDPEAWPEPTGDPDERGVGYFMHFVEMSGKMADDLDAIAEAFPQ
jgi:hypothetical protein